MLDSLCLLLTRAVKHIRKRLVQMPTSSTMFFQEYVDPSLISGLKELQTSDNSYM